jgi:hypothetical protein
VDVTHLRYDARTSVEDVAVVGTSLETRTYIGVRHVALGVRDVGVERYHACKYHMSHVIAYDPTLDPTLDPTFHF